MPFVSGGVSINRKFQACLVCGKNVSNPSQKICKHCKIRFNDYEIEALVGINEGKYNISLAKEMLKLRNEGMTLEDIADKFKDYLNVTPEIIDPLFRFLLKHEADDVLESYKKYLKGVKIKFCDVCGKEFIEPRKINGQTTCKPCRKKYKPTEIIVIRESKVGKYNKNTAIYAYNLRKMGLNNREIAEELKIPSNLVTPIIDLLLPKGYDESNKDPNLYNAKPKNICKYCGNEFSSKISTNDLFCSNCNRKYDYSDLLLFIGIKEGNYSFKLAVEIYKLQKSGLSDKDISEKLHIPEDLINKILNHFGFNGEQINQSTNIKNCSICGNLFVMAKGTSNQQYCPKCKEDFTTHQRIVLAGINEGKFNKKLAIQIKNLLQKGESKTSIAKKLKLSSTSVIDPIIEYLYEDKMPDVMKKNNSNCFNSSNNLLITACSNHQINVKLKGKISNDFATDFMKILPKINFKIKEITFKEKEDGLDFSVNFNVEDSSLEKFFTELINLGFE